MEIPETAAAELKHECKFPDYRDSFISQCGWTQLYLYKQKQLPPPLVTNASTSGKSIEASPDNPEIIVNTSQAPPTPPPPPGALIQLWTQLFWKTTKKINSLI